MRAGEDERWGDILSEALRIVLLENREGGGCGECGIWLHGLLHKTHISLTFLHALEREREREPVLGRV